METSVDDALSQLDAFFQGTVADRGYLDHRSRYASDARQVVALAKDKRLLEVGSAPCHTTALLKLMGYDVLGVDLKPERCRSVIQHFQLNVARCDIERRSMPFSDRQFSFVLFAETLEHLRVDPLFVLSEINRVLEPGGTLLLTTPNFYSVQNIARLLLGRGFNDAYAEFAKLRSVGHAGHIREFTPREVRRLLQATGFAIETLEFKHYHFPRTRRGFAARVIFAVVPRLFHSYQIVVARKAGPCPALIPLDQAG